jgi:predicted house-cleaning noncanonical NTP pyrophosphatase (MazG superfamily)
MLVLPGLPSALLVINKKNDRDTKRLVANRDEFERLFLECLQDALTDLLGVKGREALLDYLEREHRLARSEILSHQRELSVALANTFGIGAMSIEKCIIRRVYAMLNWNFNAASHFDFGLQLEDARKRWRESHHDSPQDGSLTGSRGDPF